MAALTLLCLSAALYLARCADITVLKESDFSVMLEPNSHAGLNLAMFQKNVQGFTVLSSVLAVVGLQTGRIKDVVQEDDVVIQFENDTTVRITAQQVQQDQTKGHIITLTWEAPKSVRLEDCVQLGSTHWYGGPQQKRQYWPVEKLVLQDYSYVTKEADDCALAEPYWLNSDGIFYYIDSKVPLFVDQNNLEKDALCFIAQVKQPYTNRRDRNDLVYTIGIFPDAKQAHLYAVNKYFKHGDDIPQTLLSSEPRWSTWVRHKRHINHDAVIKFADEIAENGFTGDNMEIDDHWETCYGSMTVDQAKFPNMKQTVAELKARGFDTTLWAHPFINKDCEPTYSGAQRNSYLVTSEYGSAETSWWNDGDTTTAYIDFTNPNASEWYTNRLQALRRLYGVAGFKLDAGESTWAPQIPVLQGDVKEQPGVLTQAYVQIAKNFPKATVNSGHRTQRLSLPVSMIEKDSYWTFENGLPTLITTLLQMNMNGYSFVVPDNIGGNALDGQPTKELYIRWLQANTFMPVMTFSLPPWEYDKETIELSKKFIALHKKHSPQIQGALQTARATGAPVNGPVWWLDPSDPTARAVWDEYLVGEDILVAPVLERGVTSRDVYLPAGNWLTEGGKVLQGGNWYRNYPAPLQTLPYFIRMKN